MNEYDLKHIIEATLLAAGKPITTQQLLDLFEERERPTDELLTTAIGMLIADYEPRGIELVEVASGWRIQVRPKAAEVVSRLWSERPAKYSRAFLETLALIAYRQPITRSEIEEIRGVSISSTIMRTLQERGWIRTVGHREVPGRPELLGTTRDFLDYFGLKSLDQLPTLAELKDIESIGVQLELPADQPQESAEGEAAAEGEVAASTEDGASTEEAVASAENAEAAASAENAEAAASETEASAEVEAHADAEGDADAAADADAEGDADAEADADADAKSETVAEAEAEAEADADADDSDADDSDAEVDDDDGDDDIDDSNDDTELLADGESDGDDNDDGDIDDSNDDTELLADAEDDDEDSGASSPMVASSDDAEQDGARISEPPSEG